MHVTLTELTAVVDESRQIHRMSNGALVSTPRTRNKALTHLLIHERVLVLLDNISHLQATPLQREQKCCVQTRLYDVGILAPT
jgi:hypothetical protein